MVCRNSKQQNLPDSERGHERCETSAGKSLPHSAKEKKFFSKQTSEQFDSGSNVKPNGSQQECPLAVQKTTKRKLNCHAGSRKLVCRYKANK